MAKKTQADIEKEILEEATAEAGKEKTSPLRKVADAVKKDVASKEKPVEKEEPAKKEAKKVPQKKKKGGILEQAKETLKEARAPKEEAKEVKDTRLKAGERVYTIPLYKKIARPRRTRVAMKTLREYIQKHTKAEEVIIEKEVNEAIWARGKQKPPRSIRIVAGQDEEGRAVVRLK